MVKVEVKSQSTNEVLGQVDLPIFCVDHMRMTPPEMNLSTMIRHVEMRCPNVKIRDVYVGNEKRTGITASEVENGITLHVS
jgi:hypothetical protein